MPGPFDGQQSRLRRNRPQPRFHLGHSAKSVARAGDKQRRRLQLRENAASAVAVAAGADAAGTTATAVPRRAPVRWPPASTPSVLHRNARPGKYALRHPASVASPPPLRAVLPDPAPLCASVARAPAPGETANRTAAPSFPPQRTPPPPPPVAAPGSCRPRCVSKPAPTRQERTACAGIRAPPLVPKCQRIPGSFPWERFSRQPLFPARTTPSHPPGTAGT